MRPADSCGGIFSNAGRGYPKQKRGAELFPSLACPERPKIRAGNAGKTARIDIA
jgi:hypothetical protein